MPVIPDTLATGRYMDVISDNHFMITGLLTLCREHFTDEQQDCLLCIMTCTSLPFSNEFFLSIPEGKHVIIFCRPTVLRILENSSTRKITLFDINTLNPDIIRHVLHENKFSPSPPENLVAISSWHKLSAMNKCILYFYCNGFNYQQISEYLGIKYKTISLNKNSIMKQFGVNNHVELFFKFRLMMSCSGAPTEQYIYKIAGRLRTAP